MNLDLTKVRTDTVTPRGGIIATARGNSPLSSARDDSSTTKLREYATKKLESMRLSKGTRSVGGSLFTQEVQSDISRALKNAIVAGQATARVQVLRLTTDYTYSTVRKDGERDMFVVHDAHTLRRIEGLGTLRVHLAARPRELVEWLQTQSLRVLLTGSCVNRGTASGDVSLRTQLNVVAIFEPLDHGGGESTMGNLYNRHYADRALDAAAIKGWGERMVNALRVGATTCVIAVLGIGKHFGRPAEGDNVPDELSCTDVRRHLTLEPVLVADPGWALRDSLLPMVTWIHRLGYQWMLVVPDAEQVFWAQVVVLLDPLDTYH